MHQRGRRDRHLRRHARVAFEELEVLEHRMAPEADLADDVGPLRLGLHARELDAVIELLHRDAVEPAKEIEMPPRAAKLAVGGKFEPALFLFSDGLLDL